MNQPIPKQTDIKADWTPDDKPDTYKATINNTPYRIYRFFFNGCWRFWTDCWISERFDHLRQAQQAAEEHAEQAAKDVLALPIYPYCVKWNLCLLICASIV